MTHLTIDIEHGDDGAVLVAAGEIDLASAPQLEADLGSCLTAGPVIVDLTGVSFMDSTGLRVLLAAHEQAAESDRALKLVVTDGPVSKLLSITGVDAHLHTYENVDAARGNV